MVNPLRKIEVPKRTCEIGKQSYALSEQACTLLAVGVGRSTLHARSRPLAIPCHEGQGTTTHPIVVDLRGKVGWHLVRDQVLPHQLRSEMQIKGGLKLARMRYATVG
jgi:hypothetical protein